MRNLWVAALMLVASLSVAVALGPGVARACSCASPVSTANMLGSAERAFIGVPVERRTPDDPPDDFLRVVYDVEVVDAIKGTVPATVEIATGEGGGDCGISLPLDREVGLIPYRSGGVDSVSSCGGVVGAVELRDLREATLPAPTGSGAIAALIVAHAGPARMIAVDAQFRPLGYVAGNGFVLGVAACPGEERIVALMMGDDEEAFLDVVDVASLDRVARRDLGSSFDPTDAALPWWFVTSVSCLDADGRALVFAVPGGPYSGRVGGSLRSVTAEGPSEPLELAEVIDVAARDGTFYALSPDALTTRSPDDGSVTGTVATFADGSNALAFSFDDSDAIVAIRSAGGTENYADLLLRIPLDGGPTTTITLDPVAGPRLADATHGFVLRGTAAGTSTWFGPDGTVVADSLNPLWPVGDGYLTWTMFPGVIEAHVADETSTVLEFASQLSSVVELRSGPTVAPDAPGARPLPLVETPGSIEGGPTTDPEQTTSSAASSAPSGAPPTTAAEPISSSTRPDAITAILSASTPASAEDDSDDGSGWWVGIGIAVLAAGVALAVWQIRRVRRWIPPPEPDR